MLNAHPNAVVDGDEFCMKCSYNLRTLTVSGVCPECATPVAKSLTLSRNAGTAGRRRFMLAAKILMFTGVLLLLEYLDNSVQRYFFHKAFHSVWLDSLDDLRSFLQRALHIALGVLVLFATIQLVKVFRTRFRTSSLTATACLVTAGVHLLLYMALETRDWILPRLVHTTFGDDGYYYFWNNWCYASISCCELVLTLGAALALRKYAIELRNKALLVSTALYPVLVAPILLTWLIKAQMPGSLAQSFKTRLQVDWYFHIADDAPRFYSQWQWVLAAVTILYWMHVYTTLKNQSLLERLKENHS